MSEDMRNYFDNKVNNKRLEDEIIELKAEIDEVRANCVILNNEVDELKAELKKAKTKIDKNKLENRKKLTLISNLRSRAKQLMITKRKSPTD